MIASVAQRAGVQQRAVENENTLSTKPVAKMPSISGREARLLQRHVSRLLVDGLDIGPVLVFDTP